LAVGDNVTDTPHPVHALDDLASAAVELDHALGKQQDVAVLRFLILEAEMASEAENVT